MKALIGRKIGMTSTISQNGTVEAVTLLSVDTNTITQLKSLESDGYTAIQVATENKKNLNKPQTGHAKLAKIMPKIIREFRAKELTEDLTVGKTIDCEVFSIGDVVDVTSTSKGKGFAGTIKRHNFHRGRKTHGGGSYRRPGSIGSMYPQKIFKGKKMSGQMGATRVTIKNLKIALVDNNLKVIGVTGAVPGPKKSIVLIKGVTQ